MNHSLDFGLLFYPTADTIPPGVAATWAEAHGFESFFVPEHTHIPLPYPDGLPAHFRKWYDPFVTLSAVAAVTSSIMLGTAICLIPEHHPIHLAKTVATLDQISSGRVILGIGAGWNAVELANYGVRLQDRWAVTRERVLAMRNIWSNEMAEFHGQFVDFEPLLCEPKPVRVGGPRVLLGVGSPGHSSGARAPSAKVQTPDWFAPAVVEFSDGWIPSRRPQEAPYEDLARGIDAIHVAAARANRPVADLDFTIVDMSGDPDQPFPRYEGSETRIRRFTDLGFNRVIFAIEPGRSDLQWPVLEHYASLIGSFGATSRVPSGVSPSRHEGDAEAGTI